MFYRLSKIQPALNCIINFQDRIDFEVSPIVRLWPYRSNSLRLNTYKVVANLYRFPYITSERCFYLQESKLQKRNLSKYNFHKHGLLIIICINLEDRWPTLKFSQTLPLHGLNIQTNFWYFCSALIKDR